MDQNYRIELGANKQLYATQVDAAGQIRGAGLEAAKLRQAAAVIAAVGREDFERGWTRDAYQVLMKCFPRLEEHSVSYQEGLAFPGFC